MVKSSATLRFIGSLFDGQRSMVDMQTEWMSSSMGIFTGGTFTGLGF
jgi:hypothetical protein